MNLDDLLKNDNNDFRFRPDYGAFRSRLAEMLLAGESEEFADLFSESSSDILAGISGSSFEAGIISFQVFSDMGERSLECRLALLTQPELDDLKEQLLAHDGSQPVPVAEFEAKNVVRKKTEINLLDMFTIDEAAEQLKLSKQLLKSRIPCSDYSYVEVAGKIEIKEYYWSKALVTRLSEIKTNGANAEDIKYFADECCHGDLAWAKEVLAMLTQKASASNRDNSAQKGITKQPATGAKPQTNHHHRHNRNKPK